MIGLDTNVLVRYFAQDDAAQAKKATALVESLTADSPGYVTQVALVEVVWVLGRAYGASREEITQVIETLLRTKELVVEKAETVWKALRLYAGSSADFADCLIERVCHDAQCDYTVTFDTKAARLDGMRLMK
ncbi:type II toxin-antitoxin system VapC family toxin [Ralstonia solanacearum]|uniref:PIN domain-containing protein n=1 Tax=Ralstonia solanacearum TaxID=305 RepID=UPI0005C648EF|nr:type II toxin-antitoxin system VapC family toxin [Ralstonia solanacearum]MDB0544516.1 type II toxin-antitoxin system VapC family toxin [Ralstonia solanacearum]MDB0554311.1 type II toxin-antitoxin system VapC family toxin [Ralstonia solanacearum]MDB0559437.1 type II toxin-antitoxin system VapC family toxin [Ralstonia solanacearum]